MQIKVHFPDPNSHSKSLMGTLVKIIAKGGIEHAIVIDAGGKFIVVKLTKIVCIDRSILEE